MIEPRRVRFLSTVLYLAVAAVLVVELVSDAPPETRAVYVIVAVAAGALPAWSVTGRESGFAGFDPGDLAFLAAVGVVTGASLFALEALGVGDRGVVVAVLFVIGLVVGRGVERTVDERFGRYWGAGDGDAGGPAAGGETADGTGLPDEPEPPVDGQERGSGPSDDPGDRLD